MPLAPGDSFDRYRIEGLLGQGGMGRVFAAHDTKLRRLVALKVLRPGPDGESTGGQAQLVREAQAAAALDHPNVVAIFDVGEAEGEPYIAMELVAGMSLKAYVGNRKATTARKLGWLRDIAAALASAHARGLVHRDVKPSNVIVRDDGVVKVFDFGIARVARRPRDPEDVEAGGAPSDPPTITRTDILVGTPRYMAPEQIRGEPIDGRTDQFAWGVLAYELVTGKMPWKSIEQEVDLVAAILLQDVASPALLAPELSPAAAGVILRALSKEPGDRFPTMTEIVAALDPVASGSSPDLATAATRTAAPEPAPSAPEVLASAPGKRDESHGTKTAHAVERSSSGPRSKRTSVSLAIIASLGICAAIIGLRRVGWFGGAPPSASGAPSSRSSAGASAPRPTPVTELTPPMSDVPAAVTAYASGLQAIRDGSNIVAVSSFARAAALDPQMAAAHMRLGLYTFYKSATEARDHLAIAQQRRTTLSPRDAALLDALDPYVRRQPADHDEYQRRLRAAIDRFPGDAELEMLLAYERAGSELDPAAAIAGYDRALALDPKFGMAFAYKAQEQAYRSDFVGAVATAEACRAAAPNASFCVHMKGAIEEATGKCADLEATARQVLAQEPGSDTTYRVLAMASYALGRPLDAVKQTLDQAVSHAGEAGPTTDPKVDAVALQVLGGRFDNAERIAKEMVAAAGGASAASVHAKPAQLLVDIYRESGQDALAADVADGFIKQRAAWTPDPRGEDFAVGRDPVPMMLAALRRANRLTPEAYATQREAWVTQWKKALLPAYVRFAWIHGYAAPAALVETRDEAKRALEAQPAFGWIPRFAPRTLATADVGRVYLLADKPDEALTWLTWATSSCSALEEPILHTRAHLDLGIVQEKKGDRAAACKAYGVVLSRWGKATPKSVTATRARERAKAAKCPGM